MIKKLLVAGMLFLLPIGGAVAMNPNSGATIERWGGWVKEELAKLGPQPEVKKPKSPYAQSG